MIEKGPPPFPTAQQPVLDAMMTTTTKSDGGDTPMVRVTRDRHEEILRFLVKGMRVFVNLCKLTVYKSLYPLT